MPGHSRAITQSTTTARRNALVVRARPLGGRSHSACPVDPRACSPLQAPGIVQRNCWIESHIGTDPGSTRPTGRCPAGCRSCRTEPSKPGRCRGGERSGRRRWLRIVGVGLVARGADRVGEQRAGAAAAAGRRELAAVEVRSRCRACTASRRWRRHEERAHLAAGSCRSTSGPRAVGGAGAGRAALADAGARAGQAGWPVLQVSPARHWLESWQPGTQLFGSWQPCPAADHPGRLGVILQAWEAAAHWRGEGHIRNHGRTSGLSAGGRRRSPARNSSARSAASQPRRTALRVAHGTAGVRCRWRGSRAGGRAAQVSPSGVPIGGHPWSASCLAGGVS